MQLKQMDYQLKEQFEQAQHQRRLREIEFGNLGKEGAANVQGGVRKQVQQQSAMNQSQMIEQREGLEAKKERFEKKFAETT